MTQDAEATADTNCDERVAGIGGGMTNGAK